MWRGGAVAQSVHICTCTRAASGAAGKSRGGNVEAAAARGVGGVEGAVVERVMVVADGGEC